jgi:adenosine deaminase
VPLRQLVEAGAQVALGADDPLLFGSRLSAQYEVARTAHRFSDVELAELARGSVRGSRAPEQARKQMLADIDRWFQAGAEGRFAGPAAD